MFKKYIFIIFKIIFFRELAFVLRKPAILNFSKDHSKNNPTELLSNCQVIVSCRLIPAKHQTYNGNSFLTEIFLTIFFSNGINFLCLFFMG